MDAQELEQIGKMLDQRMSEAKYDESTAGITLGSIWAAFIDFRQEMREGFQSTHAKQDKTNGTLQRHERQIAFASGGVAVISFLIAVFAVYFLTKV